MSKNKAIVVLFEEKNHTTTMEYDLRQVEQYEFMECDLANLRYQRRDFMVVFKELRSNFS